MAALFSEYILVTYLLTCHFFYYMHAIIIPILTFENIADSLLCSITVGQRKKVTAVTFFPARPRPDQRGTNMDQIRKVPVHEITWYLVYGMGETRAQLGANNGILVCLIREIWQFKLFAGKEVTAVPATRGEGGYWRRGRRSLCLCWNWIALSFLKHWK